MTLKKSVGQKPTLKTTLLSIVAFFVFAILATGSAPESSNTELNRVQARVDEGERILQTIASRQRSYRARNGRFITCFGSQNDCWQRLGFDSAPHSNDFTFKTLCGKNGRNFLAVATLNTNLGNIVPRGTGLVISSDVNQALTMTPEQMRNVNWFSENCE
jgi:hypothetical protein